VGAERRAPRLLYADGSLLVFDKPPGLLSVRGRGADKQDCLASRAQALYPDARTVHRLDMATSGLLVMARGAAGQRILDDAFARSGVHKRYQACVQGRPPVDPACPWQTIDLPLVADWPRRPLQKVDRVHGRPSRTRWRLLQSDGVQSRLELEPVTGRSHQLRVHLLAIGHPILGGALYDPDTAHRFPRLMLHATEIAFAHPDGGRPMHFTSTPEF